MRSIEDYTTLNPTETAPPTDIEPNAFNKGMFKQIETEPNKFTPTPSSSADNPLDLNTEPEEVCTEWSEDPRYPNANKVYTTPEILELISESLVADCVHDSAWQAGESLVNGTLSTPETQDTTTTSTYQRVRELSNTAITTATNLLEYLKDKGILKYAALVLTLLVANYLGEIVHSSIPIINGIPTIVGTIYLSSLIRAENREKVLRTINEYIEVLK